MLENLAKGDVSKIGRFDNIQHYIIKIEVRTFCNLSSIWGVVNPI